MTIKMAITIGPVEQLALIDQHARHAAQVAKLSLRKIQIPIKCKSWIVHYIVFYPHHRVEADRRVGDELTVW